MVSFTTLIDPATLVEHLNDESFRVVDCRFALNEPAWGECAYTTSHIPGAVYADLNRHLSGRPTGLNGRHPLPPVTELRRTLGDLGIDGKRQVVAYDQDTGMFASRLWWMLRWLGHDAAAVLDGGFDGWLAAGYPVSSSREPEIRREFSGTPRPGYAVDVAEVTAAVGRRDRRLLDARAPERFDGVVEPIDRAAGHIPGARNYFFKQNLDGEGRFLPPATLRAQITAALDGVDAEQTIVYCGSGVSAAHNLLAMEHAGLRGAKLYPGSWSEWSSDGRREVEKRGD
jgi:thiosulfate/3-mercaptopyruvate sulfurtransferase